MPSSRSDVFATRSVSVVEKRVLMKFLSACVTADEGQDAFGDLDLEAMTFAELLKRNK